MGWGEVGGKFATRAVFRYSVEIVMSRRFAPRRGVSFPSRAGASGSHHLPWALPRVLQPVAKIKGLAGGSDCPAARGCGVVC